MLILIGAYMSQEVKHDFLRLNFQQWLGERPEIQHILGTLSFPELYVPAEARTRPAAPTPSSSAASRRTTSSILSPMAPQAMLTERAVNAPPQTPASASAAQGGAAAPALLSPAAQSAPPVAK
jgi:hypothetical protein